MKTNIKAIRIYQAAQGLSVNELITKAQIPRGTWCAVLRNKTASKKTLDKLAAVFECKPEDLIMKE